MNLSQIKQGAGSREKPSAEPVLVLPEHKYIYTDNCHGKCHISLLCDAHYETGEGRWRSISIAPLLQNVSFFSNY